LRVFENGVLRRICGPKREEGAGGWRRLHNEKKLHSLYALPNIISVIKLRMIRWTGRVAWMGEIRRAYNILIGKPEGKRPLGRHTYRWEDNIRMFLGK